MKVQILESQQYPGGIQQSMESIKILKLILDDKRVISNQSLEVELENHPRSCQSINNLKVLRGANRGLIKG